MKKRNVFSAILIMVAAFTVSACGSSSGSYEKAAMTGNYAAESAYDADYGVYENDLAMEEYADSSSSGTNQAGQVRDTSNRKLITTVNISAETEDMDKSLGAIDSKIRELGGYTERSDIYNGTYSSHVSRNASLTIRIPADRLDEFIAVVEGGNNITNKSVNVDDVTLSYVDTESRKNSLRTEEQRLLEIMEKAETVEDIITIEDKLANVRYEIESVESQLRSYDNKVDYSTVYLDLNEVKVFTPVEKESAFTRMGKGFMESLQEVIDGIVDFCIYVVSHIPQLVLLLIIVLIVVLICRAIASVSKKQRAKKMAKMQAQYQAQAQGQAVQYPYMQQQQGVQQNVNGNVSQQVNPSNQTPEQSNTERKDNGSSQ